MIDLGNLFNSRFLRKMVGWLACFLLQGLLAICQNSNFIIKHYNTENGLPQNSVIDVGIDRHGFAWLSTENGLVRFDGQTFRNFNLANCPQLKNTNRMRAIFTNAAGKILFSNSTFDIYEIKSYNQIAPITTTNIVADKKQIASEQATVVNLSDFDAAYTNALRQSSENYSVLLQKCPLYKASTVTGITQKELYVQTDSGIYYLNQNGQGNRLAASNFKQVFWLNDSILLPSGNGRFTVYYKSQKTNTTLQILGDILADGLYSPTLNQLTVYGLGKEMVLKMGNNFYTVERSGAGLFTRLLFGKLYIPNLSCIKYDPLHSQYFFGTGSDGFYLVKKRLFHNILQSEDALGQRANVNVFTNQLLLAQGKILTDHKVIFDVNGTALNSKIAALSAPYTDSSGNSWFVADNLIINVDSNGKKLLQIPDPEITGIRFFTGDNLSGKIWCAASPNAIYSIDRATQKAVRLNIAIDTNSQEEISCLKAIDSNSLWIGTNNGLYLYHQQPFSLQKIPGSEHKNIRYVLDDKQQNISWAASYGQGPGYIKEGQYYPLPTDEAGKMLTAHCFVEDSKGYFWIPTNHGLFQVLKKDWLAYIATGKEVLYYQYYNNQEGFASNEFNGGTSNPFVRRANGMVSLPSMKGLVWFYPDTIEAAVPNAPLFIDNIRIDNHDAVLPSSLTIPNNYTQLGVTITTPYFGNKENLHIAYQVEGMGDKWIELPENYQVILSRLRHGKYNLHVRSCAGFGGKYLYTSVPFEVLPTWYETGWFYALVAILALAIVLLLVRLRLNSLLRNKKELEKQVASRTFSLHETVENYKNANEQLATVQQQLLDSDKTKEDIIAVILHDLWSPLNAISNTSARINRLKEDYSKEELLAFIASMSGSTSNITQLTEQLLKWLRSQQGAFTVNIQPVNVYGLLQDIVRLYKEIAALRGNSLLAECPADAICQTDPTVLTLIVRNLVDNANKNTKNGIITIDYQPSPETGGATIKITDTGKGMAPETIEQIMALKGNYTFKTASLGFRFVFDFASMIQANITIERGREKGTAIAIWLPEKLVEVPETDALPHLRVHG